jgi:hypothetical protein
MNIQQRAKEFCDGAFSPFGVDTDPYAKIVAKLIEGAMEDLLIAAIAVVGASRIDLSGECQAKLVADLAEAINAATREMRDSH